MVLLDHFDQLGPCPQASLCYPKAQRDLQVPVVLVNLCFLILPLALVVPLAQDFHLDLMGLRNPLLHLGQKDQVVHSNQLGLLHQDFQVDLCYLWILVHLDFQDFLPKI